MIDTITMTIHNTTHIPEWWRETTLARIVTFSQWFQISTDYQSEELKEWFVRFVRIVDYTNTNETPRYIENPNRCFVNMDDLVMIRYWSQTAWKIVRGISGVIANNTFQVIPQIELDKNWLFWYLKQERIYEFLNKDQSSSTMPAITFSQVGKLEILLPPLHEQRAIADMLSSLDAKIELLREQNETLEKTAQTIFHEWFGQYSIESVEKLPEGWRVGKLGEVIDIRWGGTPSTTNHDFWDWDISWTSPKDLSNSKEVFLLQTENKITIEWLKQISSWLLPIWTLLLSSRAPIWYLALTNIEVAINQGYIAFVEWNYFWNKFMYLWLKSNMQTVLNSANGSTFLEISKSSFRNIEVVIPEKNTINEFEARVNPMFEKILSNLLQIKSLSKTRDTLLLKLMSGEVRVG